MLPYETGVEYLIGFWISAGFDFKIDFHKNRCLSRVRILNSDFSFGYNTPPDPSVLPCLKQLQQWFLLKILNLSSRDSYF